MLHSRINLLKTYLTSLPPCYLTESSPPDQRPDPSSFSHVEIDYPILRSIKALLHRIPLLIPADQDAFAQESLAEKNDVALVSLLGALGQSIKDAKELGSKFSIIDSARQTIRRGVPPPEITVDPSVLDQDAGFRSGMGAF